MISAVSYSIHVRLNQFTPFTNQVGETLVTTIVAMGIVGILMMTIVTMITDQNKNMRGVMQKTDAMDYMTMLKDTFKVSNVCDWQFSGTGQTIDLTSVAADGTLNSEINIPTLYTGADNRTPILGQVAATIPKTTSGVKISSIKLRKIANLGVANQIAGILEVSFDQSSLSRPLAPMHISKSFVVAPGDPVTAKNITKCINDDSPLTIVCQDLKNSCVTAPVANGTCDSPVAPPGWTLVGGSCTASSNAGNGRLIFASAPNAAMTAWNCKDRDNAAADSGVLTASGHFCKSAIGGVSLTCSTIRNTCPTVSTQYSTCTTPNVAAGQTLVGGGCISVNAAETRFLHTAAPDATLTSWTCGDKDSMIAAAGTLEAIGIVCQASGMGYSLNCSKSSSGFTNVRSSQGTFILAPPAQTTAVGAGCQYTNLPAAPARYFTSFGITGNSAICQMKDSGAASGGGTEVFSIGCGL